MHQLLGACLAGVGICLASIAQAGCPDGQEVFTSCQIADRATEVLVCSDAQVATYSYGPIGGPPDLVLTEPVGDVDFVPWPGVGKAIHETVTFYNDRFSYQVGAGFDRPFSEEEMALGPQHFGWVEVARDGAALARLTCIPSTVTYGFGDGGIYAAKIAAGLRWDDRSQTWVPDSAELVGLLRRETRLADSGECLPSTEFALGGVAMGDPASSLGKLGSPEASGVFLGSVELDRLSPVGMEIDLFQSTVVGMTATAASWDMPSGLRVGLTRGEVIQILGHTPNGAQSGAERFSVLGCLDAQDDFAKLYAVIAFGPDKRVQSISLSSLAP